MAIAVSCSGCGKTLRVKDELAGKRGKCPSCQGVVQIPLVEAPHRTPAIRAASAEMAASPPVAPARRLEQAAKATIVPPSVPPAAALARGPQGPAVAGEILGAFRGEIRPVRTSIVYRLGILLVALVMLLLPLVYVALIGLVGYGLVWHAVNDVGLLNPRLGRALLVAAAIYAAPLVAGIILILFMLKPFIAPPARDRRTRSLTSKSDPLLFAFVDRLCEVLRAPKPKRIDVDCEVNASASFRQGWWSMFGNDLVLTVGLPLAGGLTLAQFAGVLAHEFGHFTQGTGMRVTYLIHKVNGWLTRVVYQRDGWDEMLVQWCEDADWRIVLVLQLARLMVWLTQKILWVLMIAGHAVSGFMMRQMEYDADRHQIRLVGSEAFEATARRIVLLGAAEEGAQADLQAFFQEGRLADNLPGLIEANVGRLPADVLGAIQRDLENSPTRLFDTHPSMRDRIASARRENAAGILHLNRPARALFGDFATLAKNVTWDFYCSIFGSRLQRSALQPIEGILARHREEGEAESAVGRYFLDTFSPLRPLPLPSRPDTSEMDPARGAAQLKAARERMLQCRDEYAETLAGYAAADRETVEADQALALFKANVAIRPADFSTDLSASGAASQARREAGARKEQAAARLAPFEQAAAERLAVALGLLRCPKIAGHIGDASDGVQQAARILPALAALRSELPWLLTLRNECAALGALFSRIEGNQRNEQFIWRVERAAGAAAQSLRQRRAQLDLEPYPLEQARGQVTLGEWVIPALPGDEEVVAVFQAGRSAVENAVALHGRLIGRLVTFAERVEKTLGLG